MSWWQELSKLGLYILLGMSPQDATLLAIPYTLHWLICTTEIKLCRQSYQSLPKTLPVISTQTQTLRTFLFSARYPKMPQVCNSGPQVHFVSFLILNFATILVRMLSFLVIIAQFMSQVQKLSGVTLFTTMNSPCFGLWTFVFWLL